MSSKEKAASTVTAIPSKLTALPSTLAAPFSTLSTLAEALTLSNAASPGLYKSNIDWVRAKTHYLKKDLL